MYRVYIFTLTAVVMMAGATGWAQAQTRSRPGQPSAAQRRAYWNQGKAELTSYALEQARYGEVHEGRAVLVFVTEPFSRKKQVKLDNAARAGADAVEVLKLNHTRKFNTGIYPYSTMRSVFTPVTGEGTLKVTTSVQEWCGHVFMQMNRRGQGFEGSAFSYFESEGDRTFKVPAGAYLEDDVWTKGRLNPGALPTGSVSMLPGSVYMRLLHVPVRPQAAQARLDQKGAKMTYTVRYPNLDRTLSIDFESTFPFRILGWSESHSSGFGPSRKPLKTVATRKSTIMTDYWRLNRPQDRALREQLDLPRDF